MPAWSDWTCSKDSGFMKCQYSPSAYRYCMSVSITSAASIESVAFMVTSCTRPDLIIRNLMRVKAWPLPGLTYSVSEMMAGSPLTRIFIPFLTSFMRSEEHTSELQSLMRISYAVFCLKKKNNIVIYRRWYDKLKIYKRTNH